MDIVKGSPYTSGDKWAGLIVPPAMVLWGIVLPKIGRLFSRGDEQFILRFLQNTLAARIEDPDFSPR
jgi:hypothetical protein